MFSKRYKDCHYKCCYYGKIENKTIECENVEEYVSDLVFKRKRKYDLSEAISVKHNCLSLFGLL